VGEAEAQAGRVVTDLGVVVLTHGPRGEYGPLLRQLLEQGAPPSSVALVQNPTDPSDPLPEPPDPDVTVLRMPRNLAYAGGMNAGIRHQLERGAGLVLLLTQDVRLRPGVIQALVAAARRSPSHGVLGPVLWLRDEDGVFSYGGRRGRLGGWVSHLREAPDPTSDGIADCDWVDGAAILVRREVLERVGLLDERLFIYFEETELCLRATRSGWRVGVALDAEAEQESGQPARPGFHAYLISRNGFEYARQASGLVGVAATIRRALVESWGLVRAYRGAAEGDRRATRVKLAGMWLGFLDFLRRRFGPPPERVARLGRDQ
jgi:GT2 family glycosyltransferase